MVPGGVVAKISAREFVDLSELFPDDAEMLRREGERVSLARVGSSECACRITSIAQWVQAFAAFAAVKVSGRPSRALGYIRLVVRKGGRGGGGGGGEMPPARVSGVSQLRHVLQKAAAEQHLSLAKQDMKLFANHVLSLEILSLLEVRRQQS